MVHADSRFRQFAWVRRKLQMCVRAWVRRGVKVVNLLSSKQLLRSVRWVWLEGGLKFNLKRKVLGNLSNTSPACTLREV